MHCISVTNVKCSQTFEKCTVLVFAMPKANLLIKEFHELELSIFKQFVFTVSSSFLPLSEKWKKKSRLTAYLLHVHNFIAFARIRIGCLQETHT